jgi:hypothetical protein
MSASPPKQIVVNARAKNFPRCKGERQTIAKYRPQPQSGFRYGICCLYFDES